VLVVRRLAGRHSGKFFTGPAPGTSELPISEAREHLGEVVSRAEHAQERTVLTRRGKPVAVVISIEDFRELQAAEDEADLAAARESLSDPEPRVSHADVLSRYGIEAV
jgi:prevent-host-death family protein